jgi:hypothetical protein
MKIPPQNHLAFYRVTKTSRMPTMYPGDSSHIDPEVRGNYEYDY